MNNAGEDPAGPASPAGRAGQGRLSRREALALFGAGALVAEQALLLKSGSSLPAAPAGASLAGLHDTSPQPGGYAPNGTAGRTAALPLSSVELLDSPFRANQARNTAYLLFLDLDRMLRPFRINYGVPTTAQPCGGWERPTSEVRGHMTGHLMSALAITYANTGHDEALARGRYLVSQLAALQARARQAGFHAGYLSAFPEIYFTWIEAGKNVWSPYYMIHKYLAGLIDQYQLAGDDLALDVAMKLGDWVDWRTGRLSYAQMQQVLTYEYGGLPEALANLYTITGAERYLATAQRFYHAQVFDPLADGVDALAGLQANVTTPKIIACLRMWEETGSSRYRDIAQNFWDIVTGHHVYVIGGSGNYEHFQQPDVVAAQLSNFTCENCVSYNLLKLTRLLQFHYLTRTDLIDYYERTLFNQMLGEQDPTSPHGFNCYYTGLSSGAFKRQPLNYFPSGNPDSLRHRLRHLHLRHRHRHGNGSQVRRHHLHPRRGRPVRQPVHPVAGADARAGAAPGNRLPRRAGDPAVRGLRRGHHDAAGAGPGLGFRAAAGHPQRPAGHRPAGPGPAGAARGRVDRAAPRMAAGRPAGGHPAHAAGLRAHARPPGRAGGDLRPGRAERRLPRQPRPADAAAPAHVIAACRRSAPGLRRRLRPPARPPDPGQPRRPRVLHRLLGNVNLGPAADSGRHIEFSPLIRP